MNKDKQTPTQQETDEHSLKTTKIVTATAAVMLVFIVGYTIGEATGGTTDMAATEQVVVDDDHSHTDDSMDDHSHSHEQHEITEGEIVPEITDLVVEKDAKSGWNVSFKTANFTFTPENVNNDHVSGEGHAHIYVDGEKINRLYSNDYHLGELAEGEREVRVVLNTNNHQEYAVDSEVVDITVVFDSDYTN